MRVELDVDASGPRLRITDLATGVFSCLDPFELQSLAWARHADLAAVVEPGPPGGSARLVVDARRGRELTWRTNSRGGSDAASR